MAATYRFWESAECERFECRCSSGALAQAGGCPHRAATEQPRHDEDEHQHVSGFEFAGVWAFLWAAGTIGVVGLAALLGWAWRTYGDALLALWRSLT